MGVKQIKYLITLTISLLLCLSIGSAAFAATINIKNVEDLEGSSTSVTKWRVTLDVSFSNENEKSVIAEIRYAPEINKDPAIVIIANNRDGTSSYTGLRHTAGKMTDKVIYYVVTWDGRKTKIGEFVPGVDPVDPDPVTVTPPAITEPPVIDDSGITIDTGLPGSTVVLDGDEYETDESGEVFIEYENAEDSSYGFSWEFDGNLVYNYDDNDGYVSSYFEPGNMENGRFVPWSGDWNKEECSFPPCETPIPEGDIYYRVTLVDPETDEVLEEYLFNEDGIVGGSPDFPLEIVVKDEDGNEYEYIIDENGSIEIVGDTFDDSQINPGDEWVEGGDSGGGGGECNWCELLACPGWERIAGMIGDEVGKHIPPPPDWNQVADTFADVMVPRMGEEMRSAMEDVLGHPEPPSPIQTPEVPPLDEAAEDIRTPQPVDPTPEEAGEKSFNDVPNIAVNPDETGGIDLSGADPTENIPHNPEDYQPIPGQESGGMKPKTKPIDTPIPSGGAAQPPDDAMPAPGTSTGDPPSPGGTTSPPPHPEMPMPGGEKL